MSEPKYHIVFKVTGKNEYLANTGTLTLLQGDKLVMQSVGFSGGLRSPTKSTPIPSEVYHIRTDDRQVVKRYPTAGDTPDHMHHWWGIEKIDAVEWQYEWGHYRAALNERNQHMAPQYRGNFLHGKVRAEDYTHGCICERSERILTQLWLIKPQSVAVRVES